MASRSLTFDLFGHDRTASSSIRGVDRAASGLNKTFAALGNAVRLGAMAAVAGIAVLGYQSIQAASDLQEAGTAVDAVFGDGAKSVEKFAQSAAKNLGQSTLQALNGAKTFGVFGKAAGLAGEPLVKFSTDFVALAADLASFNNTTPEQAIEALGAGLRGESEPLRQYGILLDDATLKARAMEMGIYSGTGTLSQQQRVLAAQAEILAQTSLQQGDFAKTSEGLANQQRILSASFEDVKAKIGEALLPIMQELVGYLIDTVVPALQDFSVWFVEEGGPALQGFFDWVVKWKDVLGPAAAALGGLTLAMWGLNVAMAANPVGLVIAGLALVVTIATAVTVSFQQIWDWFTSHPWALALAPLLGGVTMITLAVNALIKYGPALWAWFTQLFTNFMNMPIIGGRTFGQLAMIVAGVVSAIGTGFGFVIGVIQRVIVFMMQLGAWAFNMAGQIGGAIGGVVGHFGRMVGAAMGLIGGVGSAISGVLGWFGRMAGAASGLVGNVAGAVSGIVGQFLSIVGRISGVPGQILAAFGNMAGRAAGIGADIVHGIVGGIRGAIGGAVSAAANAAKSMLDAAKGALGIKSPSRKFRDQVGKQIPAGIGEGVLDGKGALNRIVESLVQVPNYRSAGNGSGGPEIVGAGGVTLQIINKAGVTISDLIDVKIKTANGWQSMELDSGVGR